VGRAIPQIGVSITPGFWRAGADSKSGRAFAFREIELDEPESGWRAQLNDDAIDSLFRHGQNWS